jgi:thiol-disulfide isomerase/thioredoxin
MKTVSKPLVAIAMGVITFCHQASAQSYKLSLDSLSKINDPFLQESIILRLSKNFPTDNFENYKYSLAYNFAKAKNTCKAVAYLNQLPGKLHEMAAGSILLLLVKNDLSAAEALVKNELAKSDQSTPTRLKLLEIQIKILTKKADYKNAFIAMKAYYEATEKKTPILTANYYCLMSKSGKYKEALPELENVVRAGIANEETKMELKSAYAKLNPDKDVPVYFASVVKSFEDKCKADAMARMISKLANNFTITDVDGKLVSLTDLKGNILVLDFWATWCVPCVRGLPAMQMAVDKYKADPNVKFLFIHTLEASTNQKEGALKYFAEHDLDLPLYIDVKTGGKNSATSAFNVFAIPAKFVIDAEGKIRFEGFGGDQSDEAKVNELSAMIELCRSPDLKK